MISTEIFYVQSNAYNTNLKNSKKLDNKIVESRVHEKLKRVEKNPQPSQNLYISQAVPPLCLLFSAPLF